MGMLLFSIGWIVAFVGAIWLLIEAFKVSILWGLGCFIPIISRLFLAMHWEVAKKPFLIYLGGFALVILGVLISPHA